MKKLVLPIIVLVALALFVIACGGPEPTPTPPPPADILNAATAAMEKIDSAHLDMTMAMTMTAQGMTLNIPITMAGDMQNPDRFKGKMSMSMMGQSMNVDMVVIGDTTYVTDPTTGEWQVTTAEEAGVPFDPKELTGGVKPEDIEGLTFVGEEMVGDRPAYHLTGKVTKAPLGLEESLGAGGDVNLTADYWIDKETNYTLKTTVNGDLVITGDMEATINMAMTILFSAFDVPVTIEAPEVSE
ncbi:MAG: LppX_LprAFG lipoprotein [Anaerolineae bacterium]|nr:LppX_LprAFG lipoprotein [Anaerolineae bacterium]